MIEPLIFIAVILVIVSLWSISNSLSQIAKDLRIIAGRYDSKSTAEDSEQLIDT
jgi:hypothetical protein